MPLPGLDTQKTGPTAIIKKTRTEGVVDGAVTRHGRGGHPEGAVGVPPFGEEAAEARRGGAAARGAIVATPTVRFRV